MNKFNPKAAFTLIELLVVVAIIAILAAILFPVLSAAKERGWNAACQSNLHQLGIALRMYADDHADLVPFACDWEDRHDNPKASMADIPYVWEVLNPYTKGNEVWRDPADKGVKFLYGDVGGTGWPPVVDNLYEFLKQHIPSHLGSSYSYRTALVIKNWDALYGSGPTPESMQPVKLSEVPFPSRAIVFMDPVQFSESRPPTAQDWNAQWHTLRYPIFGWNVVMADGHVETETEQKLFHPAGSPDGRWLLSDYYIRSDYPYR